MTKSSTIFARVEPEIKKRAEDVLKQLGIPMSNAVEMFLRQIVLQQGIPFDLKLSPAKPLAYDALTKEQFDLEIRRGILDYQEGNMLPLEQAEAELTRKYDL